ncbi:MULTISPECIES: STAS domain-containing protein [unclassified Streptomyces]|jgi:anti-anti-sigma factor|uniref:STAS domain-containing protein n=1 Tax=unclassified Streptomyces TaxID=2593676 RepID=UPI0040429DB3
MYKHVHRTQIVSGSVHSCAQSRGTADKPPATGLAVASYTPHQDRICVRILGELDLDSASQLRHDLHEALAVSDRGLALDLSKLDFCDCAGLRLLMELRQRAVSHGKTVVIDARSTIVDRLLTLLGAQELFRTSDQPTTESRRPAPVTAPSPKTGMSPGAMSSRSRVSRAGCLHTPRS